jgi:hypothetical protein
MQCDVVLSGVHNTLLVLMSRVLALALIGVLTVGFNPKYAWSNTGVYRSLTCGGAAYSLYRDETGLVSGVLVANLFSDVPIIVVVSTSTGSPDWRRGRSFTYPSSPSQTEILSQRKTEAVTVWMQHSFRTQLQTIQGLRRPSRLGHESIETTHIYVEADLAIKERALERIAPANSSVRRYKADDTHLAFLASL